MLNELAFPPSTLATIAATKVLRGRFIVTYHFAYRLCGWTPEEIAKERARFMARHWYKAWVKRIPRG